MVWIHGGAFVIGSGDMYDPKYFLDHEIIIVSFNYRVGALGKNLEIAVLFGPIFK